MYQKLTHNASLESFAISGTLLCSLSMNISARDSIIPKSSYRRPTIAYSQRLACASPLPQVRVSHFIGSIKKESRRKTGNSRIKHTKTKLMLSAVAQRDKHSAKKKFCCTRKFFNFGLVEATENRSGDEKNEKNSFDDPKVCDFADWF